MVKTPLLKVNDEFLIKDEVESISNYGASPNKRTIDQHLRFGIINLDKPPNPSSQLPADRQLPRTIRGLHLPETRQQRRLEKSTHPNRHPRPPMAPHLKRLHRHAPIRPYLWHPTRATATRTTTPRARATRTRTTSS